MSTYKNRNDIRLTQTEHTDSEYFVESHISAHTHTGTHVDAPSHFIENGLTIDKIPLSFLCAKAAVIDYTEVIEKITDKELEKQCDVLKNHRIVLLKTRNSLYGQDEPFNNSFVYVDQSAAYYLKQLKVHTVGIDYLGIERNQKNHPTHKILLENGVIIEGLRLGHVETGSYMLYCLPLKLEGMDASPARAVLVCE